MRRGRIAAPIALVAALVCATWTVAAEDPPTEPGFRVESARVDPGEVVSGTEKTGTFTFHIGSRACNRKPSAIPS